MIVTIARVADPDRFLEVFETVGAERRREHGCRGARVSFDPDDPHRAWSVFAARARRRRDRTRRLTTRQGGRSA